MDIFCTFFFTKKIMQFRESFRGQKVVSTHLIVVIQRCCFCIFILRRFSKANTFWIEYVHISHFQTKNVVAEIRDWQPIMNGILDSEYLLLVNQVTTTDVSFTAWNCFRIEEAAYINVSPVFYCSNCFTTSRIKISYRRPYGPSRWLPTLKLVMEADKCPAPANNSYPWAWLGSAQLSFGFEFWKTASLAFIRNRQVDTAYEQPSR